MNERLKQLMLAHGVHKNISEECQHRLEFMYEATVRECAKYMYETYPHSRYEINYMRKHMGDPDWNKSLTTESTE